MKGQELGASPGRTAPVAPDRELHHQRGADDQPVQPQLVLQQLQGLRVRRAPRQHHVDQQHRPAQRQHPAQPVALLVERRRAAPGRQRPQQQGDEPDAVDRHPGRIGIGDGRADEIGEVLLALENLRQQMNRMVSGVHEAAASISLAGGELASGSQDLSNRLSSQAP